MLKGPGVQVKKDCSKVMEAWVRQRVLKHPGHADQSVHGNGGKNQAATKMTAYMEGFHKNLKNPAERKYCEARSKQMVKGDRRSPGMSSQFGVEKSRVRNLEIVLYKVFKAGKAKFGE